MADPHGARFEVNVVADPSNRWRLASGRCSHTAKTSRTRANPVNRSMSYIHANLEHRKVISSPRPNYQTLFPTSWSREKDLRRVATGRPIQCRRLMAPRKPDAARSRLCDVTRAGGRRGIPAGRHAVPICPPAIVYTHPASPCPLPVVPLSGHSRVPDPRDVLQGETILSHPTRVTCVHFKANLSLMA